MRLTSGSENRPMVYRAQCLFFGEESLRYLAERINAARKTRWQVHCMPLATLGSRDFSR